MDSKKDYNLPLHFRFDNSDFCKTYNQQKNQTHAKKTKTFISKKHNACLWLDKLKISKFFEILEIEYPHVTSIYIATPNLNFLHQVDQFLLFNKSKFQVFHQQHLQPFLKKHPTVTCLDGNLFSIILSTVEQFILSDASRLIYSEQSTFSSRARALNPNKKFIRSIFTLYH